MLLLHLLSLSQYRPTLFLNLHIGWPHQRCSLPAAHISILLKQSLGSKIPINPNMGTLEQGFEN
jgi:hypothetical protein